MVLKDKEVAPEKADAAAQRNPLDASRRAFLNGDWKATPSTPAAPGAGPVVIGPACLALNRVVCRSCAEHCKNHAIHFRLAPGGIAVPLIRAERCDGCGACIEVCPTSAITLQTVEIVKEEMA